MKKLPLVIIPAFVIGLIVVLSGYYSTEETTLPSEVENITEETKPIETKTLIVSAILEECGRDKHCVMEQLYSLQTTETQDTLVFVTNQIPLEWEKDLRTCHDLAHHLGQFIELGSVVDSVFLNLSNMFSNRIPGQNNLPVPCFTF